MFLPGKPGSSGVMTTLFLQPTWLRAIWLMEALSEYSERPAPLQTTQSADLRSSYSGARLFFLMARTLSLTLLVKPMLLILLLMFTAPDFSVVSEWLYYSCAL